MAVNITKQKNSWSVEVKTGVDKDGSPKFSKKSLPGYLQPGADTVKINAVVDPILAILAKETRLVYITEIENYIDQF